MTPENFAYWLQGFVETSNEDDVPSAEQWNEIKNHLKLVFTKVTPSPAPSSQTFCTSSSKDDFAC